VAADFSQEEGGCEEGHAWHRGAGLRYFHLDLILEELRVLEGCLVEDEYIGEGRDEKVNGTTSNPGERSDE